MINPPLITLSELSDKIVEFSKKLLEAVLDFPGGCVIDSNYRKSQLLYEDSELIITVYQGAYRYSLVITEQQLATYPLDQLIHYTKRNLLYGLFRTITKLD